MMTAVDDLAQPLTRSQVASLPMSERFAHELAHSLDQKRLKEGKFLYHVTVTYTESNEFPITLHVANRNLQRFHSMLLEYLADSLRYHRPWFRAIEPELHAFVDIPGSKLKPFKKSPVPTRDSTFHHHIVLVAHEHHRKKLDALINAHLGLFAPKFDRQTLSSVARIQTLCVQSIDPTFSDITRVVDYASFHARKLFGKSQWEDMYIPLPRALSERAARLSFGTIEPH